MRSQRHGNLAIYLGAAAAASLTRSFLSSPINLDFSSAVWKRPWPNLDEVSMNLRLISSCRRAT